MRIKAEESYEQWMERVRLFELDYARHQLAKGIPVDQVLSRMGERIQQKLLHPVIVALKDVPVNYDLIASKKAYEEAYLKRSGPKADHVIED